MGEAADGSAQVTVDIVQWADLRVPIVHFYSMQGRSVVQRSFIPLEDMTPAVTFDPANRPRRLMGAAGVRNVEHLESGGHALLDVHRSTVKRWLGHSESDIKRVGKQRSTLVSVPTFRNLVARREEVQATAWWEAHGSTPYATAEELMRAAGHDPNPPPIFGMVWICAGFEVVHAAERSRCVRTGGGGERQVNCRFVAPVFLNFCVPPPSSFPPIAAPSAPGRCVQADGSDESETMEDSKESKDAEGGGSSSKEDDELEVGVQGMVFMGRGLVSFPLPCSASHCAWPACARPGLLQIASVLLNLGPAHPAPFAAVKVPASTDELRAFGEKALRHALEGWFRERGLSYCTGHAGVRCTGNSDDGCVLNQWTLGVTMAGTQMTLRYQLPNPVQPLRPARFLDVHINGYLNTCSMTYGLLDGRPCPVHPEWLQRAQERVGVKFVVNDVPWLGYDSPPLPDGDDEDGGGESDGTDRDSFVVPGAELYFAFSRLPAVLGFFLPLVGHAKQCCCVSAPQYFRKGPQCTTTSYIPDIGMPYHFYNANGDMRAMFGALLRHKKGSPAPEGPVDARDIAGAAATEELVPAYAPTDCIGLFPEPKTTNQCDNCNAMVRVISKAHRAQKQRKEGTHVTVNGETIFVPKTSNSDIIRATLGPYGQVNVVDIAAETAATPSS